MARQAFDNPSGPFFYLSKNDIDRGVKASGESDRLRIIQPLHRRQDAEVQRLVNYLQPGSYIRPHKHPMPHASESIVVLQGKIRFFTFDADGGLLTNQVFSSDPFPSVFDIEPGVWHSFVVMEPDTVIFECKKGPYNAVTDKEFAGWAPEEGSPGSDKWLKKMENVT